MGKFVELQPMPVANQSIVGSYQNANKPLSATAQSGVCIRAARQAVQDGRAKTATPPHIFTAVLDGLLDLLGLGLKYPPAADAWDLTLQSWDSEFAKYQLTDAADVIRVAEGFKATKRYALSGNGGGIFPKALDVINAMPPRVLHKGIEHQRSEEEVNVSRQERASKRSQLIAQGGVLAEMMRKNRLVAAVNH